MEWSAGLRVCREGHCCLGKSYPIQRHAPIVKGSVRSHADGQTSSQINVRPASPPRILFVSGFQRMRVRVLSDRHRNDGSQPNDLV